MSQFKNYNLELIINLALFTNIEFFTNTLNLLYYLLRLL
ncbi:hypothetical protein GM3709_3599 [Geminocystis sp. NIES-3709]|nr:hypothetical protein GM3709_3599 [Geminocystis sp. NIES-3709]